MAISIFIIFIIIVAILIFIIINKKTNITIPPSLPSNVGVTIKRYQNEDYYIINGDYSGEYDLQYKELTEYFNYSFSDAIEQFEQKSLMNYSEYKAYCEKWSLQQKYSNSSQNYIVFSYVMHGVHSNIRTRLAEVEYDNNDVNLYIWDDGFSSVADFSAYVIVVPTTNTVNNINLQPLYTLEEFDNIKEYNSIYGSPFTVDKPIIYLYPEEETEVLIKLGHTNKLTCSYPKYPNDGWKVIANPNGDLFDLLTGKNLYALYYESKAVANFKIENTGFVVKGEDTIKFLEEKLEILGLNEREAEEFIIYWLPKLEYNNYNYIRFATMEEIDTNMPLNISPNPDTIIRVLMTYKPLEQPIDVEEQKLITPERKGFVAVEWGGTEIK